MTGNGGRRSRRSGGSEAMPLLRCPTKHDMARVVHAARQSLSVHRERHQQAQGATIRAAAAGQDVASRKLILRAFAAADEFKSARSLASSVRLKAQAKLIDDPEGEGKAAGKAAAPCGFRKRNAEPVSHAEKFGARRSTTVKKC